VSAAEAFRTSSTPSLSGFDPRVIPYQFRVIQDVRKNWSYKDDEGRKGRIHEFILSGSVGSAKSILLAHLGVTHCLMYSGAKLALCRKAMPDLKETILATVLEHMEGDLVEGKDYTHNKQKGSVRFSNGSEIISRSWADKKFKKFRSVALSAAIVEELTENDDSYKAFYPELRMRVGRLPHVPESWIGVATNPDSPAHWAHKHWITSKSPTRHVYYSVTTDNPFLPPEYVAQLKRDLDPKMALRMLEGQWIEISQEVVYHAYDKAANFRDRDYEWSEKLPIVVSHDFNIGVGKPMSACAGQYDQATDEWHWAEDFVVDGADTEQIMEEIAGRELFERRSKFLVRGDAAGKNRDTRSKRTDYQIIQKFLADYRRTDGSRLEFEIEITAANPPVRTRHNLMNGYMRNTLKEHRFFVYRKAPTLDEAMRLTKLKNGGQYIEDDQPAYQHVGTAAGYAVCFEALKRGQKSSSSSR